MKKAIGFDYGGVIGGRGKIGLAFTEKIAGEILGVPVEEYRKVYFAHNHLINTGKVTGWREFWPIILEKFGQPDKLNAMLAMSEEVSLSICDYDADLLAYIDGLRERGHRVGLLSNATRDVGQLLRGENLHEHFDAFIISGEVGLQKPDPKIFELFAQSLATPLENLIFIDDAQVSLSTATQCGYTPLLFRSVEQMRADLESLIA